MAIDRQKFIEAITRFYRNGLGNTLTRVELDWVNRDGWESEIYAFTAVPDSSAIPQRMVLRLLTGASTETARDEFETLSRLHRAGYPVPEVIALGGAEDGFDGPFIIMQRIEGGNFARRFPRSPGQNLEGLRDFVSLFIQLHSLDVPTVWGEPDPVAATGSPFVHFDREMAFYHTQLENLKIDEFSAYLNWLANQRNRAGCVRSSIIHRDFHPDNILEDADGKAYVIDWTSAEISDYRFDLAWTLTLALAYRGADIRQMILDEYQGQLGHPVPELDVFEVVSLMRRIGTVMISLKAGAEALGMRPQAVEAMRREKQPLARVYQHLVSLTGIDQPAIAAFIDELD